jgi:hypothetical protein
MVLLVNKWFMCSLVGLAPAPPQLGRASCCAIKAL